MRICKFCNSDVLFEKLLDKKVRQKVSEILLTVPVIREKLSTVHSQTHTQTSTIVHLTCFVASSSARPRAWGGLYRFGHGARLTNPARKLAPGLGCTLVGSGQRALHTLR